MIGSEFKLFDLSDIPDLPSAAIEDNAPVVLVAAAFAKGTEKLISTAGTDYIEMYGDADFDKYGQISEQTMRAVANGARVLCKRLVAPDSTLANAVIVAEVYQTKVQVTDGENNPLYIDGEGNQTTVAEGNEPVYNYTCNVKYVYKTIADAEDFNKIKEDGAELLNEEGVETQIDETTTVKVFSYPIFAVADNGRGVSNKRWYIGREKQLSKTLDFMFYRLNIVEDGNVTNAVKFSLIPDTKYRGENVTLGIQARTGLNQAQATSFDKSIIKFINKVQELSLIDKEELLSNDILFGTKRKGTALPGIVVDDVNGLQLDLSTGFNLQSGSNGSFGDAPYTDSTTRELVEKEMLKFYNGELTDAIWDKDNFQIDLIFDADFPVAVKEAIIALSAWREDFMYFRDYGLDINNFDQVLQMHEQVSPSIYASDFCQVYDVVSPYTTKINTVTMTYSISAIIINHMMQCRHLPFAGQRYNAIITDIVDGSLRYAPRVTPTVNEKDELEEIKVNFASYFSSKFIIESLWTSQVRYTQLSFSNNVIALQQVIKALRKKFPQIRYAVVRTKEDLKAYEKEVNDVLSLYSANFAELSYEYIEDPVYRANKIFRAKLNFRFADFFQAEKIDVYALPTEELL